MVKKKSRMKRLQVCNKSGLERESIGHSVIFTADSFENEKYGKDPKFEQEDLKGKVKEEQEEEKGIEEGGGGGEEEEEEEEDDDDEGSESDDPDRLWCICQQPHDDR